MLRIKERPIPLDTRARRCHNRPIPHRGGAAHDIRFRPDPRPDPQLQHQVARGRRPERGSAVRRKRRDQLQKPGPVPAVQRGGHGSDLPAAADRQDARGGRPRHIRLQLPGQRAGVLRFHHQLVSPPLRRDAPARLADVLQRHGGGGGPRGARVHQRGRRRDPVPPGVRTLHQLHRGGVLPQGGQQPADLPGRLLHRGLGGLRAEVRRAHQPAVRAVLPGQPGGPRLVAGGASAHVRNLQAPPRADAVRRDPLRHHPEGPPPHHHAVRHGRLFQPDRGQRHQQDVQRGGPVLLHGHHPRRHPARRLPEGLRHAAHHPLRHRRADRRLQRLRRLAGADARLRGGQRRRRHRLPAPPDAESQGAQAGGHLHPLAGLQRLRPVRRRDPRPHLQPRPREAAGRPGARPRPRRPVPAALRALRPEAADGGPGAHRRPV